MNKTVAEFTEALHQDKRSTAHNKPRRYFL